MRARRSGSRSSSMIAAASASARAAEPGCRSPARPTRPSRPRRRPPAGPRTPSLPGADRERLPVSREHVHVEAPQVVGGRRANGRATRRRGPAAARSASRTGPRPRRRGRPSGTSREDRRIAASSTSMRFARRSVEPRRPRPSGRDGAPPARAGQPLWTTSSGAGRPGAGRARPPARTRTRRSSRPSTGQRPFGGQTERRRAADMSPTNGNPCGVYTRAAREPAGHPGDHAGLGGVGVDEVEALQRPHERAKRLGVACGCV